MQQKTQKLAPAYLAGLTKAANVEILDADLKAAGAAAALLVRVVPDAHTASAAASDTRVAVALLVVALLLVGAALLLERAGIDPNSGDGARRSTPDSPI